MEEKKNKCPLCNKKLVLKDGVPVCPDCGYRDPYRAAGQQQQSGYGQQLQASYSQQQQEACAQQKGAGSSRKAIIPVVVLLAVLLLAGGIGYLYFAMETAFTELFGEEQSGDGSRDNSTAYSASGEASAGTSEAAPSRETPNVSHLTFNPPESELLQQFVSVVFGKPAASVTREDLNSVVGFALYEADNSGIVYVDYTLADGTAATCYLTETYVDASDFKCFPNLQVLDLGSSSLDWDTDWHNLESLSALACESTLEELAGYMDVSQLTALQLSCGFLMQDLSGIEEYSNLEYLCLDCDYGVKTLSGLSQASALKAFILEDGDSVTDFSELYHMPWLVQLSIESDGLRDIGFIREMPQLQSLELRDTQLMNIDAVRDCADTLTCLKLHRNYSVEDYSVVLECTGLEELELYVNYDTGAEMTAPDLSGLSGLKTLTLGNFDSFPSLGALTKLESLTLIDGGYAANPEELAVLEGCPELKSLALLDMSVEAEYLKPISRLTSLEFVDLTDTFIWGSINPVLELPNLQRLILEDADFGLKPDQMPVNESLQVLNLQGAVAHRLQEDGSWDYRADDTRVKLGEYPEFFAQFPNLMVLEAPSQELQDIAFAAELSSLFYLDITDNYVTDLTPLAGLEQLQIVVCENNPIADTTGLKKVTVIR